MQIQDFCKRGASEILPTSSIRSRVGDKNSGHEIEGQEGPWIPEFLKIGGGGWGGGEVLRLIIVLCHHYTHMAKFR